MRKHHVSSSNLAEYTIKERRQEKMLMIRNDIKETVYGSLLMYSALRCDEFSFMIPDMPSEENLDTFKNKGKIKKLFEYLKPHQIKEYIGNEYCGTSAGYDMEIHQYHLNVDSVQGLGVIDDLYDWKYPNLPDDLCFYSKGKCWLYSVAHERMCWIYTDNDIEKTILKKVIGLKYYEDDDMDAPTIDGWK